MTLSPLTDNAERRECYLAVGGGWSRAGVICPKAEDRPQQRLSLMRCPLADETAACSSSRCMKRASSKLGTVREPLARSRA